MTALLRALRPILFGLPLALPFLAASVGCDRAPSGPPIRTTGGLVMGTVAEVKIPATDAEAASESARRALAELERLESVTTTYDAESQISRLNAAAGGTPRQLPPDVDAMLRLALDVAEASDGAFDPTAGPLVVAWGFPDDPAIPADDALAAAVARVGWRDLMRLDETFPVGAGGGRVERAWRLGRKGMAIDLGGIAKGWGVDAAATIAAEGNGACLVNVGGDLAVRGTKPGDRPWIIGVQDPRDPAQIFLKLALRGEIAVATSGDYQRSFEVDGVPYHHLLDPRTGHPARDVRSVTIVAPTCAIADAWATAAFVLGVGEGLRAVEATDDVEGILVTVDAAGDLVLHRTSGFARWEVD